MILSNLGIAAMALAVHRASAVFGGFEVLKFYGIPWLCVTHWFIMITYLHHTDPDLPHYRSKEWNYQRGAAATVDRPFLGWQGRFFLHDVAHFHVVHHFFPKMPWCKRVTIPGSYIQRRLTIFESQTTDPRRQNTSQTSSESTMSQVTSPSSRRSGIIIITVSLSKMKVRLYPLTCITPLPAHDRNQETSYFIATRLAVLQSVQQSKLAVG